MADRVARVAGAAKTKGREERNDNEEEEKGREARKKGGKKSVRTVRAELGHAVKQENRKKGKGQNRRN